MNVNEIKQGQLIRIKIFKTRHDMPEHWGSDMLAFCNKIYRVDKVEIFSEEDDRNAYEDHHVYLSDIEGKNRGGVHGYYFLSHDFKKVNTLNDKKRKTKSSS